MFQGTSTNENYDSILCRGFCEKHKKELKITVSESYEVGRKAFLYLRLQIISPLLCEKAFTFDKMKSLFTAADFGSRDDDDFHEKILYLDAIIVSTICHFSEICCVGCLFKNDQPPSYYVQFKGGTQLDILTKKSLSESDINYLIPQFRDNFNGDREDTYKLGFVAAMIIVRNVSSCIKLKTAVEKLDQELNSTPGECRQWLNAGSEEHKKLQFEEAINCYSRGLKYSPYCIPLLLQRAEMFMIIDKPTKAALDLYLILMLDPKSLPALCKYVNTLHKMALFPECITAAQYGLILDHDYNSIHNQFLTDRIRSAHISMGLNMTAKPNLLDVYQVLAKEKKDVPELIEASDSDTEDVPELLEASDDSSSESETTKITADAIKGQRSQKEKVVDPLLPPSKSDTTIITADSKREEFCQTEKDDDFLPLSAEENKLIEMDCLLKEAFKILFDGDYLSAVRKYREALDEMKGDFSQIYHKYSESEIVCIKYAFGTSYCKSGGYDDLQRAITAFKGIAEDHCSVTFPAAYYGIALTYHQLNRFKEALHYLQIVGDILERGTQVEVYFWPATSVVIEETKKEHLRTLAADLMKQCENPPRPDATCRFQECSFQSAIYYTDPDFKGFFAIQCSDQCTLQYHPSCWKLLKTQKQLSDKEFLDKNCLTPDCEGVTIKIENIDKEGNQGKIFESELNSKKSTKKKTKLEKKLEVKEEKKRKRKDSSSKTEVASETPADATKENQTPSETSSDVNKSDAKTEVKDKTEGPSMCSETPISASAELFTVLKKEKLIDENVSKYNSKGKEHKKTRKENTITIDEFLERTNAYDSSTEYQQRLHVLRQNNQNVSTVSNHKLKPTAPSFEPQRTLDYTQVETTYGLDDFPQMPSPVPASAVTPNNSAEVAESVCSTFNPSSVLLPTEFSAECAKKNIYSYMKNILCKHGPLKEDDPILVRELQGFPAEANALIADCDGLGNFLQQSVEFAFVGQTYVCTVDHLTNAYKKLNSAHLAVNPTNQAYSLSLDYDRQEDHIGYSLNPDAREYSPSQGRNPPELVSAISKLRQPLTVDSASTNGYSVDSGRSATENQLTGDFPATSNPPTRLQLARKVAEAVKAYFSTEAEEHRSYIRQFLQPYAVVEVRKKSSVQVQTDLPENTMKEDMELQRLKEVINALSDENVSLKEQNELLGDQLCIALDNVTKCQKKMNVELPYLKKELEDASLELEEQKKDSKRRESKLEKEIKVLSESLKKSKEEQSAQNSEMDALQATHKNMRLSLTQAEDQINLLRNQKHILTTTLNIKVEKLKDDSKNLEIENKKYLKRAQEAEVALLQLKKAHYIEKVDSKTAEAVQKLKGFKDGMAMTTNLDPVFIENFQALVTQLQNFIAKLGPIRIEFLANIEEQINAIENGTPLEELHCIDAKELPPVPVWNNQVEMQNGMAPNAQSQSWISQVQILLNSSTLSPNNGNAYPLQPTSGLPTNLTQLQAQILANQQVLLQSFPQMSISTMGQGAIPKMSPLPTASGSQNPKKPPPGLPNPLLDFRTTAPKVPQPPKQLTAAAVSQPTKQPAAANFQPAKQPTATVSQLAKQPAAAAVSQLPRQPAAEVLQLPKQPAATVSQALLSRPQRPLSQPTATVSQSLPLPPRGDTSLKAKSVTSSSGLESLGASNVSVKSSTSKSSRNVKKACDNDALELDYNVKKKTPKKTTVPVHPDSPTPSSSSASSSKAPNRYEDLFRRLHLLYPTANQAQISALVKDFRSQNNTSGMTVTMIFNGVTALVDEKKKRAESMQKSRMMPSIPLVNKKLALDMPKTNNEQNVSSKKSVWGVGEYSSKQWQGKDNEEACTICFEEMPPQTAYKVDCGHTFHLDCIKEWMNKKSDCPICRVHLLLPEDYPAL